MISLVNCNSSGDYPEYFFLCLASFLNGWFNNISFSNRLIAHLILKFIFFVFNFLYQLVSVFVKYHNCNTLFSVGTKVGEQIIPEMFKSKIFECI